MNAVLAPQTKTESKRAYHQRRLERLKAERTPWEDLWQEIDRLVVPGYVRLNPSTEHSDRGHRRRLDVVDNTGQKAHRTFRSGMQSGMTSKARPWNRLTTHDKAFREQHDVKAYLDVATMRMREVMNRTNIYETFHTKHGALGCVGTAVSYLSPDPKYVVRNTYVMAGHYWISTNHLGQVDTLYHILPMTAHQIVGKFNKSSDNIPRAIQAAYDRGEREQVFLVYHAMEPRHVRDSSRPEQRHMPYLSNYWTDVDDDKDRLLRESGSMINRVIGSRWDLAGNDAYGYSLAMDALSDIKQLQLEQGRKLEILDKTTRPPMTGPSEMSGKRHSLLPGSITYGDVVNGRGGYRPAIDLSSYNLNGLLNDIQYMRESIKETFYNDLFLAITNMEGVQPRNEFELSERKEEKLLQLGPALERLEADELTPTIQGVYYYMNEAGMLPEMPESLQENAGEMTIEYTSILAQAQRAVGVLSLERTLGFVGGLAANSPDVLDKVDTDEAVDVFADRIGVSSGVIRSDDQVAELRAARQAQQQQTQAAEQAAAMAPAMRQGAEAARIMTEIDDTPGDPSTLLNELRL